MILTKADAYELGNALIDASDSDKDRVVIKVGEGAIVAVMPLDDGHDEGYTTIARIVSD